MKIYGKAGDETVCLVLDDILYIETVDDKTFAYTADDVVRLDGRAVDEHLLFQVAQFAFMYVTLVLFGGLLLCLFSQYDLIANLTASLTFVSNVGPALGFMLS